MLARSPRARFLLPIFAVILAGLSFVRLCGAPPATDQHAFAGPTMGTTWSLKLHAPDLVPEDVARIDAEVRGRLEQVNARMSTWDADSELSRFNRSRGVAPFAVSPETLSVVEMAHAASELTGGAFDVTVGPLVTVWGFGSAERSEQDPTPEQLAAVRQRVGFRLLSTDSAAGTLAKARPDVECDLSAIAKGFAVDQVADALLADGLGDFLIEIGGELRGHGERPGGGPWRVAIEEPDSAARVVHRVVGLRDLGMATSGDYRNFYERDGLRLSHLIDPRVGRPIAHALASVTVVHERVAWADALATALGVLGPDAGYALAEREGLAAYFIVRQPGGGVRGIATPQFEVLAPMPNPPAQADPEQEAPR